MGSLRSRRRNASVSEHFTLDKSRISCAKRLMQFMMCANQGQLSMVPSVQKRCRTNVSAPRPAIGLPTEIRARGSAAWSDSVGPFWFGVQFAQGWEHYVPVRVAPIIWLYGTRQRPDSTYPRYRGFSLSRRPLAFRRQPFTVHHQDAYGAERIVEPVPWVWFSSLHLGGVAPRCRWRTPAPLPRLFTEQRPSPPSRLAYSLGDGSPCP